jgi:hypothetical protein
MATIRGLIPQPNVLLDNFMDQIKGKPPSKSSKSSSNMNFSFKYNPSYDGLSGAAESFGGSLEDSATKMTSTIDVGTADTYTYTYTNADGDVVTEVRNTASEASKATTVMNKKNAEGSAAAAAANTGAAGAAGVVVAEEKPPPPKPLVCGPNEKKVRSNRGPGGASSDPKCIPKSSADIKKDEENKKKEVNRKEYEKNRCGPNEGAFYRTSRNGKSQLICRARACPPGEVQKLVKVKGFRGKKLKCVPV